MSAVHASTPLSLAKTLVLPDNYQISFIELDNRAPFPVKRVYWVHSLNAGDRRGEHAHKTMQQLLVAVSGSLKVTLDDGSQHREFILEKPNEALWVPAGLWRSIVTLKDYSTLLSLASTHFDEQDYIRDYDDFLRFAQQRDAASATQQL